jgi:predicted homoserine dehydrogenase-like protein
VAPVALAHHVELRADVAKGATVRWEDVIMDESLAQALELRRETEALVAEAVLTA